MKEHQVLNVVHRLRFDRGTKLGDLCIQIKKNRWVYAIIAPAMIWFMVFWLQPIYGILLAFKKYNYKDGIIGSPFIGFTWFEILFIDPDFWNALENTLIISAGKVILLLVFPVLLAILLNEIRSIWYRRVVQSLLYLPHFLSWVIIVGLMYSLLSVHDGIINKILVEVFNSEKIVFLGNPKYFLGLVFSSAVWHSVGWTSIVYLAAISGVNPNLYDAAAIDGAGKLKQVFFITLPSIKSTIIILLILSIGRVMNADFDQIFNLYGPTTLAVGDIIDTYVYRTGVVGAQFEYSTAVGLFKNIINCILLLSTNRIAKWLGEEGI